MGHENLLSYYPSYSILDEVISSTGCKKINIFVDLKNNLQTVYMKHAIEGIIETSLKSRFVDTSVFSSLISFLTFHKLYSIKRNVEINFYIFFESGQSYYHTNISKKYKIRRKVDDLYGLDKEKRDYFFEVLQKNLLLIEKAAGKLPNVYVMRLHHLEADFIPYYLIKNKMINEECAANVIYSNDHDMLQCVNENTFIFKKTPHGKKLIKKGEVLKTYLKFQKQYPDEYLPLIMAIIGDTGDDVEGLGGIGPSRVEECIDELVSIAGGMENLFSNLISEKPLFEIEIDKIKNKYTRKVIEKSDILIKNLKLVSFEVLSRYLKDPFSTELLEKRKYIEDIIENKKITDCEVLKSALEKTGVYITEEYDSLYFNKNNQVFGDY